VCSDARVSADAEPSNHRDVVGVVGASAGGVRATPPLAAGLPADLDAAVIVVTDREAEARRDEKQREFVANAAHRLHNPLMAIAAAVEVLQAGAKEDPAERDRFLQHIEQETARLTRLTRALLTLARVEAQGSPPLGRVVELRPLLERLASAIRPGADVEVSVDCPDDIVVVAPPDLLEEALANVLDNSARYTDRGSISIDCERVGSDRARIVVADTGIGIAPEDRERIFDRFFRGAPEQPDASGLGLAITREIVYAVGGEISVESIPDQGSSFALVLPSHEKMTAT
jgi:two-component system, OmpR family, phosphate regulon sensor histidine kinase PhoR